MPFVNQVSGVSRPARTISTPPVDLLVMAYSEAIMGCREQNADRAAHAILALRDSLNYDYQTDLAVNLYRLYDHCGGLVRKGQFERAAGLLSEVRDAWASTLPESAPVPEQGLT